MKHGFLAAAIVGATASVLSACNSTDSLYAQGPWGPAHVRRDYPDYSAPWGRRPAGSSSVPMTGPAVAFIDAPDAGQARPLLRSAPFEPDPPVRPVSPRMGFEPDPGPVQRAAPAPALPDSSPVPTSHAALPEHSSPPGVFAAPRQASSYAGSWKAAVGSASCRIQLSSTPSLDLYKASAQGCSDETLRRINGWSVRDEQVILFSRGEVIARLAGAEASLEGALGGSGARLKLSR